MAKDTCTQAPRPEHPRPDFVRPDYINLNGKWQFEFDDDNRGMSEKWYRPERALAGEILVPFCYQSAMSGIGGDEIHPVLWYRRKFDRPEMTGKRTLLKFGAVDYRCQVYVNGQMAGTHTGGYAPFEFDITDLLLEGENDLCLRVEDEPDCTQPRGKQHWERGLMGCWYTPVSGIWQTVWMESAGDIRIRTIHVRPDIDRRSAEVEIALNRVPDRELSLMLELNFEGTPVRTVSLDVVDRITRVGLDMRDGNKVDAVRVWDIGKPNLYDLRAVLTDAADVLDDVSTYFGMRKVEVVNGEVLLNNSPIYQRLILDQGYWPESLITPPSDEAIRKDVELTLAFGYNGARKHQKLEDPRYYYWADKMGMLVWGEVPSPYDFCAEEVANLTQTLQDFIARDFNHPSIIAWVPLNESWGVREIYADAQQQAASQALYYLAKAADGTRLVSGNDGWEQTVTDICALHDYADTGAKLDAHFAGRQQVESTSCDFKMCYCKDFAPRGSEAFMVTEYGGIAMACVGAQGEMGGMETWGYHDKVTDEEAFLARFQDVTDAIRRIPYCRGYCYTQLTDVMQEINGLLTPDRQPKVDPARIRAINVNPDGRERG